MTVEEILALACHMIERLVDKLEQNDIDLTMAEEMRVRQVLDAADDL